MQVASGRFGVTPAYLMSGDQLEIKIAQVLTHLLTHSLFISLTYRYSLTNSLTPSLTHSLLRGRRRVKEASFLDQKSV